MANEAQSFSHGTLPEMLESYDFIAPQQYAGKLKGKVAIVTGTSVGIGRVLAKAFAAAGAKVAAVARREPDLKTLVEEIQASGGVARAIVADVAERGAAQKIVSETESELGPVDILINNAGISRIGNLDAEPEDLDIWWQVYEVNVRGPVALTRAVLPGMLQRKSGILISISSVVATMMLPTMTAYSSSKAAISKFHESLFMELQGTGVLSYTLSPGMVPTELGKQPYAINKAAMEHPALKAFVAGMRGSKPQSAAVMVDVAVAMCADERYRALDGRFVDAMRDVQPVVEEANKEGGGRVGKEDLYRVRIPEL